MQCRPITLLILALLGLSHAQANAGELRKQAQLRISMTIVDSCDVELVRSRSGAAAEDARVECSTFMPHHSALANQGVPASAPRPAEADSRGPSQSGASADLAAFFPTDLALLTSGTVTIATVIF